jgi:monovalent cation:proton antiporter-2 (CPA2) family protein
MHDGGFLYQAFIYLTAAVISVPVAKRLGLGSVLGYLLAGIIIGPFVLGLVGEEGQDVMHFAEFGVVMMLFLIGLELEPALLWRLRVPILGVGGSQVGITTIVITIIGIAIGLDWRPALAIGLTLALSSTALVMQSLNERGLMKTEGGRNAFSVLLFQDIAVIPILAILPVLAQNSGTAFESHSTTWIHAVPLWGRTLIVIGIFGSIVMAGRYLITPIFRIIARTRLTEIFTAAALLLVIAISLLMMKIGVSPALGAFLAGVLLAQSEYRHELETNIMPFKGLLLGLFFIAVGASLDLQLVANRPGLILELVGLLIIVKFIILFAIAKIFGLKLDNSLLFAFSLAQGGEFAFVLFSYAIQNNVVQRDIADILIASVVVSMAITPLLMLINEKLIQPRFGTKEKDEKPQDDFRENNRVIIAGFGRVGSVAGRFLQANGVNATYLDLDPDNVDLLRKLGLKVYYGDASRYDLLEAAGAKNAELLIVAVDNMDKAAAIIETAQKHFPNLHIMARATGWENVYDIIGHGINDVYRETFDTAIKMGSDALIKLGHRSFQVTRAAKRFTRHDREALFAFAKNHETDKNQISHVREHIKELEERILEEQQNSQKNKDLGWDVTSRIKSNLRNENQQNGNS